MTWRRVLTLWCAAIMLTGTCRMPLHAQGSVSPIRLSLADAISRVLEHSEDLAISRQSIEKMDNTYTEVRASAYPQLSATLGWNTYITSPVLAIAGQEFDFKQEYEASAGAMLTQVVWAFGKVSAAIDIARQAFSLERFTAEATAHEVAFMARQLYYTGVFARESAAIARRSYADAVKNDAALKERFIAGRVSRMDNVKMAADVAVRQSPVLKAEDQLARLLADIRSLAGLAADTPVVLTDGFSAVFVEYDARELQRRLVLHAPALKAMRQAVELKSRIAGLRERGHLPILSAYASYTYSGDGNAVIPRDEMDPAIVAGLSLNFPLWDSGAIQGAFRQAVNDREIARLGYEKKKRELTVALDAALSQYRAYAAMYRADQEAIRLARESYRITQESFGAGQATLSQLNDAERQLTLAELQALTTLYNLHLLQATIARLAPAEDTL